MIVSWIKSKLLFMKQVFNIILIKNFRFQYNVVNLKPNIIKIVQCTGETIKYIKLINQIYAELVEHISYYNMYKKLRSWKNRRTYARQKSYNFQNIITKSYLKNQYSRLINKRQIFIFMALSLLQLRELNTQQRYIFIFAHSTCCNKLSCAYITSLAKGTGHYFQRF